MRNDLPERVMSVKHTSGPWTTYTDRTGAWEAIVGPNNEKIASVYGGRKSDGITVSERKANARLLATAPKLLAAVRMALRDKAEIYRDTFDSRMDNDPTVIALRAAIAEVERQE